MPLPIWTWVVQLGSAVGRIQVEMVISWSIPAVMSFGRFTCPAPGRLSPAPYFALGTHPALPWSVAAPMDGSVPELAAVVPVPSSKV